VYKPDPREATLILLRAIEERGQRRGRPMTRARLTRITLKRLWNREQLSDEWLRSVNEWLVSAGWVLIDAGKTLGVVKIDVVENWPRVASRHLDELLIAIRAGKYDFVELSHLLERHRERTDERSAPSEEPGASPTRRGGKRGRR
jgi:hypothetical protein